MDELFETSTEDLEFFDGSYDSDDFDFDLDFDDEIDDAYEM